MCRVCGYVVPRLSDGDTRQWIKDEEGSELWCGGAWHEHIRPHFAPAEKPLSAEGEVAMSALLQAVHRRFGSC